MVCMKLPSFIFGTYGTTTSRSDAFLVNKKGTTHDEQRSIGGWNL
jgi:hypothetical protein